MEYFNPRTPREVRPQLRCPDGRWRNFNPRTPREVRLAEKRENVFFVVFQSTHPARGATVQKPAEWPEVYISIHAPRERCDARPLKPSHSRRISIHAPRERCDCDGTRLCPCFLHFNPRTPREVRLSVTADRRERQEFQSTHPARGATSSGLLAVHCAIFQSTHPARGATGA